MKKRSIVVLWVGIIIWAAGCKQQKDEKFISEGEIIYDAQVLDISNPMASMAPTKMTVRFKANKSCAEMNAGLGLFSTSFISDPHTKTFTQLVKIITQKVALTMDYPAIQKQNESLPMNLIQTNETKVIAGYTCKKMKVIPLDKKTAPFDIYYTDELDIKDPNFTTPFYKIPGVLMEYQLEKFGLEIKFTAKSVKQVPVDDKCFHVPHEYRKVSEKEMKRIFEDLQ